MSSVDVRDLTRVAFSRLDKVLYPDALVTKAGVIDYYIRIAPRILPFLSERLLTLNRFPDGIGSEGFFEKNAPEGTPAWIDTFLRRSPSRHRDTRYLVCNSLDALLWIANLAALELHISLGRRASINHPDFIFFDLDPRPPATFSDAADAALAIRSLLEDLGYAGYVKTSGRRGLHVLVPITPTSSYTATRTFVRLVTRYIAGRNGHVPVEGSLFRGNGRVVIDDLQNAPGRTMVAPYSLRADPRATVSTPVTWDELERGIEPVVFTLHTVPARRTDPWENIFKHLQKMESA
ncbi:MAG: hypothetical protein GKC04_01670 [Methanomicrobiales archaeon]|nr:hypothetical protein [Methanomicrobiales archaeon]